MADHKFVVTVSGCSEEQAKVVMSERLEYDEDYGFEYHIMECDPAPDLMKVSEVASILRVSPMTVYRMCEDGRLSCVKMGGSLFRVHRKSLSDLLKEEDRVDA